MDRKVKRDVCTKFHDNLSNYCWDISVWTFGEHFKSKLHLEAKKCFTQSPNVGSNISFHIHYIPQKPFSPSQNHSPQKAVKVFERWENWIYHTIVCDYPGGTNVFYTKQMLFVHWINWQLSHLLSVSIKTKNLF